MSAATNIIPMPATDPFDLFWQNYPRRVARLAAEKAFAGAIKVAAPEIIMAGLEQYKKHKPATQEWCHAATWLNGQRWQDQYDDSTKPINGAEMVILGKELDRCLARIETLKSTYGSMQTWSNQDKLELQTLKSRREVLRERLGLVV